MARRPSKRGLRASRFNRQPPDAPMFNTFLAVLLALIAHSALKHGLVATWRTIHEHYEIRRRINNPPNE